MVARVIPQPDALLVIFTSDGQDPETQLAPTGERALKIALLMLARRDALRAGDNLSVRAAEEGADLP